MTSTRCGFVAILGAANVGKSTLINTLVGEKVSIVTSKAHTTRTRIYGVVCRDTTQMVLVDTPGLIQSPKGPMQYYMRKAAWRTTQESAVNLILVDAHHPNHSITELLIRDLAPKEAPVFLVLNKVDHLSKEILLPLAQRYNEISPVPLQGTFMISGRYNRGVEDMIQALLPLCPTGPWMFPEDTLTQLSQRFMAAEITREKVFKHLYSEVPYSVHVETDLWYVPGQTERAVKAPASGISLFQTIFVEKVGQRKLILGHQGQRLRQIGQEARLEISRWLGKTVHVFLYVKVMPTWKERPEIYTQMEQG